MQTHWLSVLEAAANVVAGIVLAFLLQLALFDAMAITASLGQSLVLTLAFAALSLVRAYVLRRLFNRVMAQPALGPGQPQSGVHP